MKGWFSDRERAPGKQQSPTVIGYTETVAWAILNMAAGSELSDQSGDNPFVYGSFVALPCQLWRRGGGSKVCFLGQHTAHCAFGRRIQHGCGARVGRLDRPGIRFCRGQDLRPQTLNAELGIRLSLTR